MQLSWLPGLINRGAWRGQIEAVRIARDKRSLGLGATMIAWAVERFRERGCFMAQLTSNNDRAAAHRFYERLGWKKSHSGFKLYLT
jgi:GNAT superfamily N-acetyltransferase